MQGGKVLDHTTLWEMVLKSSNYRHYQLPHASANGSKTIRWVSLSQLWAVLSVGACVVVAWLHFVMVEYWWSVLLFRCYQQKMRMSCVGNMARFLPAWSACHNCELFSVLGLVCSRTHRVCWLLVTFCYGGILMVHALVLVLSIQDDLISNTAKWPLHRIIVLCYFMTIV